MGLNIKNERVHALAREAARVTGGTQTSAIEEALVLLLRSYGADPGQAVLARRLDQVRAIVQAYADDPGDQSSISRVEDLYDAKGLPG